MAFDDEMTERERWAEDHGYWHWKCRNCGMSGWTDTSPDCACRQEPIEEEEENAGPTEYAGDNS